MKKLFFTLSIVSVFLFAGCGNKENAQDAEAPSGMMQVDLSSHGLPLLIYLPDSSLGTYEIEENAFGGINIKAGKNFQISIIEGAGNFDMKRSDIATDAVRKFVNYVIDEPTTLLWQWQIEGLEPEFHFYTVINAGNKSYEVQDIEGELFSQSSISRMLESGKSIRMKDNEAAN